MIYTSYSVYKMYGNYIKEKRPMDYNETRGGVSKGLLYQTIAQAAKGEIDLPDGPNGISGTVTRHTKLIDGLDRAVLTVTLTNQVTLTSTFVEQIVDFIQDEYQKHANNTR